MSLFGFDTHRGSWSSPANRNWLEARQEIQSSLHWGSRRITETSNKLPCLVPKAGGWACFLRGVTIGACPGVWLEGWFRWFAHPLCCWVQGTLRNTLLLLRHPVFAPGPSETADGFWFWFVYFISFGLEFALTVHAHNNF